ncbi:hypothetical protein [Streptomyces nigrescens]|uniref:Uncharacterized protein n=1 Tax=Streptomyces nigrescens TaxID=1920 RepID=A0A640TR80_STRNI|nr:hypothetical protein [Streptomyces libani]WAU00091.1 hypothetical protein STRLI_006308 [Streptomyces libani subsp. libani]GFE25690.1 hypothetical protein Sliba_61430 [Streptomyces libani subsp. libani]GGV98759.1 hypothetical protein GCM10010500_48180 [Streptomyces libani subsp. libani]
MTTSRRPEILAHLKDKHGIDCVTMAWLRNRFNPDWDKLSRPRADEISGWLKAEMVLHQPAVLPSRDTEQVTLYSLNSRVGMLIAAARGDGPFADSTSWATRYLQAHASNLAKQESGTQEDVPAE